MSVFLGKKLILVMLFFFLPSLAFADDTPLSAETKTAAYFAAIENNPSALEIFFQNMPKGGDLHNHFAGAVYAENLLKDSEKDQTCFDTHTFSVLNTPNCHNLLQLRNIESHPDIYDKTINAWSVRNFVADNQESEENHFFASFDKFLPILAHHNSEVLAGLKTRAASEHVDYLELMISAYELNMPMGPNGDLSTTLSTTIPYTDNFAQLRKTYLARGLPKIVSDISEHLVSMEKQSDALLHCGTKEASTACQIKVRYQYYALRDLPLNAFFAQLLTGFEVANTNPKFVGVNIVRPEDDYLSIHQYEPEMRMIAYLHHVYPNVHISLHAGELNPKSVAPQDIQFHIRDAITIAHAERIGHGTDIAYEDNAADILKEMAAKPVAVEINLTSNADVIGVAGKDHPLLLYLAYHVPVTLSTDDEGVLRTNLIHEYVTAVENYHLDYATIKNIDRNSLTYSFISGKSLWQNAPKAIPVSVCEKDVVGAAHPSAGCALFLKNSEKAQAQWQLESELAAFEKTGAQNSG